MKQLMKKIVLLVALCMVAMTVVYAQEKSSVEIKVNELVQKYENVNGVDCITVVKGAGLGMVKTMLNAQFGKDFMKGVTGITIIDYSDASQETCIALRKELDIFKSMLEEFDEGKENVFADDEYVRSFAAVSDDAPIVSDFIIAVENKDSKMIMYMAGKIKVD